MTRTSSTFDRRTLLKGAGGAAAAATMISLPGRPTAAQSGEGKIIVSTADFARDAMTPLFDAFTADSGIAVEWTSSPSAGGEQVTQLAPQFASESTPVDVLNCSDEAAPGFLRAGWLLPLNDALPEGFWDDFPQAMKDYVATWSSQDDQVYRVPNGWEYGYYWTRQDVLDELGLEAPATWDDMRALGEAAKARNMYAFGDAASQPSLAFVLAAYQTSQSGGDLFTFDDNTRAAFEFTKELLDKEYFPKDAINWNYDQSNAAYMEDQLVTMRQWSFFYDVSRANTEWFAEDKAVIALPPSGPARRGTWAGAWGWTVPAFTKVPDEAKAFVTYISAPEQAVTLADSLSNFITPRTSVVDALGDKPFVQLQKMYSDADVVTNRPFHARVSEAQAVVDTVFNGYLAGQFDIDEAMSTGTSDMEALG